MHCELFSRLETRSSLQLVRSFISRIERSWLIRIIRTVEFRLTRHTHIATRMIQSVRRHRRRRRRRRRRRPMMFPLRIVPFNTTRSCLLRVHTLCVEYHHHARDQRLQRLIVLVLQCIIGRVDSAIHPSWIQHTKLECALPLVAIDIDNVVLNVQSQHTRHTTLMRALICRLQLRGNVTVPFTDTHVQLVLQFAQFVVALTNHGLRQQWRQLIAKRVHVATLLALSVRIGHHIR
mmetsp:Transcript_52704/g.87302  ORF Transcript_52704/g.87302 Transcript_52704/m.87302 type:complete len:234 (+) Transcript_52704:337-1038(+)